MDPADILQDDYNALRRSKEKRYAFDFAFDEHSPQVGRSDGSELCMQRQRTSWWEESSRHSTRLCLHMEPQAQARHTREWSLITQDAGDIRETRHYGSYVQ